MKLVSISKVAEFINGRAFKPEEWEQDGLPIIRIQNLTGSTDVTNYYSGEVEPKYLVKDGDILISWSASLGVYIWEGGDAILNQHIFKVVIKEDVVDKMYFYYAAQNALNDMIAQVHGATMQHITRDPFLAIEIPLPPLPEQRRIADLLSRADRLRHLRRVGDALSASLLQSVFLEMFGDPANNPKRWEVSAIEDLLSRTRSGIQTGPFGSSLKRHEYVSEGIPVWGINNLGENQFIEDEPLYIAEEKFKQLKNYSVEGGDIFISRAGTVGKMCVAYPSAKPSIIGTNLIRISLDFSKVLPEYFTALFTYFGSRFSSMKMTADENAYSFINPSILRSMAIPVPPLPEQEQFAAVVRRVELRAALAGESERQVEGLFQSLLALSFVEGLSQSFGE